MSDARNVLNRVVRWMSLGLTGAIVLGWAGLFSLYVRGRWIWGHWPRGGPEDPKDVGEGLHYTLAGYSAATLAICTVAVFVVLAVLAAVEQKGARSAKVVALTTAILSVLMVRFSPLVWWYAD
jgi:FtsH-binding integral membrane protein